MSKLFYIVKLFIYIYFLLVKTLNVKLTCSCYAVILRNKTVSRGYLYTCDSLSPLQKTTSV